jgi:class 3 adenylate cyclase
VKAALYQEIDHRAALPQTFTITAGEMKLKGFSQPVAVFEVELSAALAKRL